MMRTSFFKSAPEFAILSGNIRSLSAAELELVTGGDAGCGPGDCGAGVGGDPGGTLGEVTVHGSADDPGGGQGQATAEQMMNQMEFGMANPALALFFYGIAVFNALKAWAANHPTPPVGNPMGDPRGGGYVPAGGP